jgi:DNA-3-methyladenine glycosylase
MKLPASFYEQPTLDLAKRLLGKILVRNLNTRKGNLTLKGKIVETEAYLASPRYNDEACHAYRGITARNRAMFGEAGSLYIYFTYGNHFMLNIVTEPKGEAAAVLIRALEPLNEFEFLKSQRGIENIASLANGPGKLTQAFQIDRSLNGMSLQKNDLYIENAPDLLQSEIQATTRVGITKGVEHLWRFFIKGNPFVSKGKPSGSDRRLKDASYR